MSTKEDPASKNVVSLVFRKVVHTNEVNYSYKKVGQPVLQVDFLGDVHTFEDVGEALFKNYLREILDEELYEHMWRFCPCDDDVQDSVKLSIAVPILSKDMQFAPAFQIFVHDPVLPTEYRIKEGTDLIFRYDEGSPTVLAVTVESIKPMPADKKAEDYPLVKAEEADPAAGEKRKRISEAAVLTITMDEAYPLLANRLLKESRVALNIGRGSDEIPNKNVDDSFWGRIWGGGSSETCNAAYDRSVEIPRPFSNIDEAWLCLEKGIDTQMSPGHPCVEKITERKSRTTGQLYREVDKERMKDFTVVLRPYPSSVPRSEYLQEMEPDFAFGSHALKSEAEKDPKTRSWSRFSFSYALPANWKEEPENTAFSFAQQFPKCALWLTYPAKSCQWLSLEHGVLCAVKGKNKAWGGVNNVVHKTLKHDSLHAAFADLEEQIVLPASWKYKPARDKDSSKNKK